MDRRSFCKVLGFAAGSTLLPGLMVQAAGQSSVGHAVPDGRYTIGIRSDLSGCDLTHAFYYSDSFFAHPATQYDHQLALATLGLVCAAANTVASDAEYWVNGSVGREAHIAAAYETLGFEDALFYNYDLDTGRAGDFVGYSLARKTLTLNGQRTTLVALVLRGGGYGGEWVSNAHAVEEAYPDHAVGFKAAADGVYDAVTDYLDRRGFDLGRVKLWLCGYSRGGAVTNLLGARFTFESGIGKDNIFAYSFATPVTVFDRACLFTDNIFNIMSEMDIVPRMPLRYWALTRYGADMIVPCKARRGLGEYTRLLGQMQAQFAEIMGELGVEAAYVPLDDQERALDLLFDYIDDLLDTPEKYRDDGYQQLAMDYMRSKMHGDTFELRKFINFLLDGNEEMADELCSLIDNWHDLGGIEKVQRLGIMLSKRKTGDKSPATEIIFMVIGILFRYAAKYTATKVTGGSQDYFYEQLVILIIDAYQHGGDSFILQQHWPEAYLAWLRAAPPEDLFRVGSYERQSIK